MNDLERDRLRALRLARGLTQEQVATAAGLDRVRIVRIENGWEKASKYETRVALARGLGVDLAVLDAVLTGAVTPEGAAPAATATGS